jgi:hypothetical protein
MMKRLIRSALTLACVCLAVTAWSADKLPLHPELEPMRPFLGITWRGERMDPGADRPRVEVVRYDRTLNGEVIRMLHSINNGDLVGEMVIRWNENSGHAEYHYFTSAGYYTTGLVTFDKRSFTIEEQPSAADTGTPPMRTVRRLSRGRLLSSSHLFVNERWTEAEPSIYVAAPEEKLRFR